MHVIWIYGRPGSGKTTLGRMLHEKLPGAHWLDGDVMRRKLHINEGLGFSEDDRHEATRHTVELIQQFATADNLFIVTMVTPLYKSRSFVENAFGANVTMVGLDCSLSECARRDPKGHYAAQGTDAVGFWQEDWQASICVDFNHHKFGALYISTENQSVEQSFNDLWRFVGPVVDRFGGSA